MNQLLPIKWSKICLFLHLILVTSLAFAQEKPSPTDSIVITGNIKASTTINIHQLQNSVSVILPDLTITNHLGEVKGVAKNMKGVLLKKFLENLPFDSPSPKQLSEFYFVFIATDGYKVVYSWNELFNNDAGNQVYIITEKEGKSLSNSTERILVANLKDFKTGRRYIKGLQQILVKRS